MTRGNSSGPGRTPPSVDDLAAIGERVLADLPEVFRSHLGTVEMRVEEFPDAETEAEMELESPFDLLGLYRGVSLDRKSLSDPTPEADLVFLYRRPLLDYWCETGEDLEVLVRHVLIHELGHHFGFSDADMERIEAEQ